MFIYVCFSVCDGSTHQQLRDQLMRNYGDVAIRPVKDTSTKTTVTIRPLFQNLIYMVSTLLSHHTPTPTHEGG